MRANHELPLGLAAPISDHGGHAVGAIGVVGAAAGGVSELPKPNGSLPTPSASAIRLYG